MIAITRAQARLLRALFRRRPLGLPPRGPVPPLMLVADGGAGLRVRHQGADLAVEWALPVRSSPAGSIPLPLDALAECEGGDATPVVLESAAGGTVVRWQDRGIPREVRHAATGAADPVTFPAMPSGMEACPSSLLDALAEAHDVGMDGSPRYDLDCVQLRGDSGELVATDGSQLLARRGFHFPWAGDVLVRRAAIFASRALARDGAPVLVGRADAHVVVRVGAITIWMAIRPDARFPRVEGVVPSGRDVSARLRLDPSDAAFLADALGRLPGGETAHAPVTLDLNGVVAVRARGDGGPATELVLSRSRYDGVASRVATARSYLARALAGGPSELLLSAPGRPMAAIGAERTYAWQPLEAEAAWGPDPDATRVTSAEAIPPSASRTRSPKPEATRECGSPRRPNPAMPAVGPDASSSHAPASVGLASLIAEADALHALLADARARAKNLAAGLRRRRAQDRRVRDTLRSLGDLRLQGVAD